MYPDDSPTMMSSSNCAKLKIALKALEAVGIGHPESGEVIFFLEAGAQFADHIAEAAFFVESRDCDQMRIVAVTSKRRHRFKKRVFEVCKSSIRFVCLPCRTELRGGVQ